MSKNEKCKEVVRKRIFKDKDLSEDDLYCPHCGKKSHHVMVGGMGVVSIISYAGKKIHPRWRKG